MARWRGTGCGSGRRLRFEQLESRRLLSITINSNEIWDGVSNPHAADGVTLVAGAYTIPTDVTIGAGVTIFLDDPAPLPGDLASNSISWTFAPGAGGLTFVNSTSTIDVNRGGRNLLPSATFTINMNDNPIGGAVAGAGRIINGPFVVGGGVTGDTMSVIINSQTDVFLGAIDIRVNDAASGAITVSSQGVVDIRKLANADVSAGGGSTRAVNITGETLVIGDVDTRAYRVEAGVGDINLRALRQPANSVNDGSGNSVAVNSITLNGAINTNGPPVTIQPGGNMNLTAAKVILAASFSANLSENGDFNVTTGTTGNGFTANDVFVNSSSVTPDTLNFTVSHLPAYPGDANADGIVDAADYTVWRDTLGSQTDLRADFDHSGTVDTPDYGVWKAHFGEVAPLADPPNSVTNYGATPNDSTNDEAAIQAALNANASVYFPPGEYWLNSKLVVPAGRTLYGPSTGAPAVLRVRFDTGTTANNYAIEILGNDVVIKDLVIDKDFIDGSYGVGIIANNRSNVTISGVEIRDYSVRYGIHLIECSNFQITNCYVHDFMMNQSNPNGNEADMIQDSPAGIRVTRSVGGSITNSRIHDIDVGPLGRESISELVPSYGPQHHQADGITLSDSSQVLVENNNIWNSGELIDVLVSDNVTVRNNVLQMAFNFGVKVIGSQDSVIADNYIGDAAIGVWVGDHSAINQSTGIVIDGNEIVNAGSSGVWNIAANIRIPFAISGIYVDNNAETTTVSNNNIYNFYGYLPQFIRQGTGNNTFFNNQNITNEYGPGAGEDAEIVGQWTAGLTHDKEVIALNRALVFFTYAEHADTDISATAVSYGGQSLAKLNERIVTVGGARQYISAWMLLQDKINMAADGNFAVTWNSTPDNVGYSSVFAANVYQPAPIRNEDTGAQDVGNTLNTSPRATVAGDLVFFGATAGNPGAFTANNGFTKALEIAIPNADGMGGYKIATGANEFGSTTHTNLGGGVMYMGILRKNPATLAGQATVDVTTLGIVSDDGINDAVALQNALNTLPYDDYYFPSGTYDFQQAVFIPSNKTVRGDQAGVSRIETLVDTTVFRVDNSQVNVAISNFTIERPQTQDSNNEIIRADNADGLVIADLRILSSASRAPMINLMFGANNTVRNTVIADYQVVRSETSPEAPGLHPQVFGVGINLEHNTNVTVANNQVIQNAPLNIDFNAAVIKGVHQSSAIQVINSSGGTVSANYIFMTGQGMDLGASSNLTVSGNFIDEIHSAGIKLVNGSHQNTIEENYLRNNGLTGIWVSAGVAGNGGSYENLVQNNTLVGIGKGFGLDFWETNFALSTPAAIHLQAAQLESDRVRNNTIVNNNSYDNDEQRNIVMAEPSNAGSPFEAYINDPLQSTSNTSTNNAEQLGAPPAPPELGGFLD